MKVILKQDNFYLLRFDKDEELISSLTSFCDQKNIFSGSFSAIGAAKEVILSYYNLETKKYQDLKIEEDTEIVGILGNIANLNNKKVIHCHGSIADNQYIVKAGHIKKLVVSATCEVMLSFFKGKIERAFDEETGLNLMK